MRSSLRRKQLIGVTRPLFGWQQPLQPSMQRVAERARSLKKLLEKGADALLPQKVGDFWHKPEVSARLAARAKKMLLADGKCEDGILTSSRCRRSSLSR